MLLLASGLVHRRTGRCSGRNPFCAQERERDKTEIGDKATDLAVRVKEEAEEKAKIGTQWFLRAFPVSEDLKGGVE